MKKAAVKETITQEKIEQFILDAGSDDLATFGGTYEGGIHIQQIPDEIGPAIFAMLERGAVIESYLEIGAAAGGTTYLINHFFRPQNIVLVDDNRHHKAGLRSEILKDIDRTEIVGSSHDENVIAEAREHGPYDLILIDGDHQYQFIKLDTVFYLPMLKSGGFFAMHDSIWKDGGIPRVVKELKENGTLQFIGEFVSTKHQPALGIALFRSG